MFWGLVFSRGRRTLFIFFYSEQINSLTLDNLDLPILSDLVMLEANFLDCVSADKFC